jgi:hypothetical protein
MEIMYQISLYGPHAAAHWPCETFKDASETVYRWSQAVVSPQDTPEDWHVVIEESDPTGNWVPVACFDAAAKPSPNHDTTPLGLGGFIYS